MYSFFIVIWAVTLGGCSPAGTNKKPNDKNTTVSPTTKPTTSTTTTKEDPKVTPTTTTTGTSSYKLSGLLTYDFVSATSGKINYAGSVQRPMRNVYVELVSSINNEILGKYNTTENGEYTFTLKGRSIVKLRIYAEMKSPSVIIQDNTSSDSEYVLVSPEITVDGVTTRNVNAITGWSGTNTTGSYVGTRMSAPFAMLDSIYTITKKISAARPSIVFPALKLNWSVNNVSVSGNKALGKIGTSHYDPVSKQLFILGQADVDSDEFDNHIIVHEWGHFFEDTLSRSDSGGGPHGGVDMKDIPLALSEGFGNALSAMAFDPDYFYVDTNGARQQNGFQINIESGTDTNKGWFSENSIQQILYDIYDSTNETGDTLSLGIGPILDVFTGYEKITPATTSIFSFIYGLKTNVPSSATALNTLLATKNIAAITTPYGGGETNDGGWNKNLPVYHALTLGGAAASLSLYGNFGNSDFYGLYNSVFNNKYLKFTASSSVTRFVVTSTDTFQMDVYKNGVLIDSQYKPRNTATAIGPFTFNVTTMAGAEYTINLLSDQDVVYDSASVVNLTVAASAQ
jgi:hypothetical protein